MLLVHLYRMRSGIRSAARPQPVSAIILHSGKGLSILSVAGWAFSAKIEVN